jgi:hypothetical protein
MSVALSSARGRSLVDGLITWWIASHVLLRVTIMVHWQILSTGNSFMWNAAAIGSVVLGFIPGLVLGGWKAVSVAFGRATIRRKRDVVWISVFGVWVVGWSLLSLVDMINVW